MKVTQEEHKAVQSAIVGIQDTWPLKKITYALAEVSNAKTFNEFMIAKRNYMMTLVNLLPVYGEHCAYCEVYRQTCESLKNCPYGITHGVCLDVNSSFHKLLKAKYALTRAIYDY